MNLDKHTQLMHLSTVSATTQAALAATATRSNKYRAFDTESLVRSVVDQEGFAGTIRVVGSGRRVRNTKHSVTLTMHRGIELLGTTCFPRVTISNSYGGESALRVTVGFFRLICTNGMGVGTKEFSRSIRHTASGEKQVAALAQGITEAIEYCYTKLSGMAERLHAKQATQADIDAILLAIRASGRLADRVTQAIQFPRIEDTIQAPVVSISDNRNTPAVSLWNVWNIVNEQMRLASRSEQALLERDQLLGNTFAVIAQAV